MRLFLAVLLVWVLGDLVPRLLAAVAPELTLPARRAAVATLVHFKPLLRLAGWADALAIRDAVWPSHSGTGSPSSHTFGGSLGSTGGGRSSASMR